MPSGNSLLVNNAMKTNFLFHFSITKFIHILANGQELYKCNQCITAKKNIHGKNDMYHKEREFLTVTTFRVTNSRIFLSDFPQISRVDSDNSSIPSKIDLLPHNEETYVRCHLSVLIE